MPLKLLVAVNDLIFLSKIREAAKSVGVEVTPDGSLPAPEAVASMQPQAIVLDLNLGGQAPVEWVRALKSDPATRLIPVVAFASHVQSDLIAAARQAGCDRVLARSAFSQQLPALLRELFETQ